MKKLRKVNTNKRKKERKALQKKLQNQTSLMMKHPKECCVCATKFERTPATVTEWKIVVREKRVRLTCPKCWSTIQEALEKEE
tara:strand:- start:299 stop:547 length:249 start_codon:yes stop_codon:yes gene_type:complete